MSHYFDRTSNKAAFFFSSKRIRIWMFLLHQEIQSLLWTDDATSRCTQADSQSSRWSLLYSHLDLSGSIYINCFYSLQHWLCKPRQILNQTHAATSLTAQTQHSAGRRLLEMCLLHRPTRNALGFTGAHIKAQTEQSQLLRDNKERVLPGEPPPAKKTPSPRLKGQGTATPF